MQNLQYLSYSKSLSSMQKLKENICKQEKSLSVKADTEKIEMKKNGYFLLTAKRGLSNNTSNRQIIIINIIWWKTNTASLNGPSFVKMFPLSKHVQAYLVLVKPNHHGWKIFLFFPWKFVLQIIPLLELVWVVSVICNQTIWLTPGVSKDTVSWISESL